MKSEIIQKIIDSVGFQKIKSSITEDHLPTKVIFCSPFYGASKSLLVQKLFKSEDQIILLMPDSKSAEEIFVELNILGLGEYLLMVDEFAGETIQERLTRLTRIKRFILVSTYNILTLNLPLKDQLEKETTLIQVGGKTGYDEITEYLNLLNFRIEKFVEAPGEFSVRGSIIDFWSFSENLPVRLEYDGDFLESIRYFDAESQRSIEKVESVSLSGIVNSEGEIISKIFDYLDNPIFICSSFELQNFSKNQGEVLEPTLPVDNEEEKQQEYETDDEFPEPVENKNPEQVSELLNYEDFIRTNGTRWIIEEEIASSENRIELGFSETPVINSNYEILFKVLKDFSEKNYDILITTENELQTAR
ncbi:MAG: transcription-repair coupling factor, partial [Ignavibacteriaceae bacterium]